MYNPDIDVTTVLTSVREDIFVTTDTPVADAQYPAFSYYLIGNKPTVTLDKKIGKQDITIVVDIWTRTKKEGGELLALLTDTMLQSNYVLDFSNNVPDPSGTISHYTTRFKLIK